MPTIAFFDVDKTLIHGYSGFYTSLELIRLGILKKRRLATALYYRLLSRFYDGKNANLKKIYQTAIDDMAGFSLERVLEIGAACFQKWIHPRIYRGALEKIEEHRARGDKIVLITSGPYMTIRILSEYLKADAFYSVGPVIGEDGVLTDVLKLPIYYREGKIVAAEEFRRSSQGGGVDWKECYFYSDSHDDLFLLEKVGKPHLVNPNPFLTQLGEKRGWPILSFSETLGDAGRKK